MRRGKKVKEGMQLINEKRDEKSNMAAAIKDFCCLPNSKEEICAKEISIKKGRRYAINAKDMQSL